MDYCLRSFAQFIGRAATRADLNADAVSRWLESLESNRARATVYGYRINLLTLWRDLAEQGLVDPPRRVRRIRKPKPMPVAWTAAEIEALLNRIRALRGCFANGAQWPDYCLALVYTAYDTGLRRSDLWALERKQIRPDGTIVLTMQKTGRVLCPRLRPETLELLDKLPGPRPLACPVGSGRKDNWARWWRKWVIRPAGIRPGALQQLRRTAATHLAIEHPEAVQRFLGHESPEMQLHYVDLSIAKPMHYFPPALPGAPR
jgi:integrase